METKKIIYYGLGAVVIIIVAHYILKWWNKRNSTISEIEKTRYISSANGTEVEEVIDDYSNERLLNPNSAFQTNKRKCRRVGQDGTVYVYRCPDGVI